MQQGRRWPTTLSREDFRRVTGESDFPDYLTAHTRNGQLDNFCNTAVSYRLRGIQVRLNILWEYESAAGGGDTHLAVFRGTRARVEVRQGKEQNFRPELYVVPNEAAERDGVAAALRNRVVGLNGDYPGLGVADEGERLRVTVPDRYRVGHEAHFGEVARQFLHFLDHPATLPAWEKPNLLAKYFVTTEGVRLSLLSLGRPCRA